jgi:hypothetical protein
VILVLNLLDARLSCPLIGIIRIALPFRDVGHHFVTNMFRQDFSIGPPLMQFIPHEIQLQGPVDLY